MSRTTRIAVALTLAVAFLAIAAGCSGPDPSTQIREHFESEGMAVKSLNVNSSPHEAQVMMDLMILNSHGITDAKDNELDHATVTLDNGEEVTAVRYKGKVYTYKGE